MLSRHCVFEDLDVDQWKRLAHLALAEGRQRRRIVVHDRGKVQRCLDTVDGEHPLPFDRVDRPQEQADALLEGVRAEGVESVWVVDLEAYRLALAAGDRALDAAAPMTAQLAKDWEARWKGEGCAVSPRSEFLAFGLPWGRLERFAAKLLPPSCTFVLGVFEGDALWATCFAQIQDAQVVAVSTSAALSPEDVRDVVGRDQHPFLLAAVANRYQRPAFGWFCERRDFEAWMTAPSSSAKEQAFQQALMAGRATFDFNILIDRGITPLGPINPGASAVAGADREANPRTRTPEPEA